MPMALVAAVKIKKLFVETEQKVRFSTDAIPIYFLRVFKKNMEHKQENTIEMVRRGTNFLGHRLGFSQCPA